MLLPVGCTLRRCEMPGRLLLSAAFQQMCSMFQAGLGQLGPAQHAGDLLGPLRILHAANLGLRAPALLRLLDQKVLIAERRNLRKMGDAQHLLALRQRLQLSPNRLRRPSADADIDLVEDQRARQNRSSSSAPNRPMQPLPPSPSAPASRATSRRPRQSHAAASTAPRHSSRSGTPPGPSHAPSSSPSDFSAVT